MPPNAHITTPASCWRASGIRDRARGVARVPRRRSTVSSTPRAASPGSDATNIAITGRGRPELPRPAAATAHQKKHPTPRNVRCSTACSRVVARPRRRSTPGGATSRARRSAPRSRPQSHATTGTRTHRSRAAYRSMRRGPRPIGNTAATTAGTRPSKRSGGTTESSNDVLHHVRSEVAGRPAVERRTERERRAPPTRRVRPRRARRTARRSGDRDAAPVRERRRVDEREHDDGRDAGARQPPRWIRRRSCPRPG